VLDPFSAALTLIICLAVFLSVLLAEGFLKGRNAERGEFYGLMLFAGAGGSLLALSNELITIFVNLEVLSIATYALAAYLRRGPRPSEAGFKYFILGAFAASLYLYGAALLYGATGSTLLPEVARGLPHAFQTARGMTYTGIALIAAGFAFKIAAVPFHMWTPDVYEGAPTPVTALMSSGVKVAGFAAIIRLFLSFSQAADPKFMTEVFAGLALLTMVVGNLIALPQRNVKRMLAYSSIAHAGYTLLGVAALFARPTEGGNGFLTAAIVGPSTPMAALQSDALRGIIFYLLGYTVTAVGAFGTIAALEKRESDEFAWDLDQFAGLAQRRPWWAFAMAVFMLSLGGIPPTMGFMAKLLIFKSAVNAGLVGLTIVAVLASAAGAYYYLRVVVYMYMRPAPARATEVERHWGTELALVLTCAAVLVLGILPGSVSTWLERGAALWPGR
jgi:NADH-quinone oxidoreductase subunit N